MEAKYSNKVLEIIQNFNGTKYNNYVDDVIRAYVYEDSAKLDECIAKFPTDFQLLESLVSKLKGKSVYTNLNKMLRNENENVVKEDCAIALSSLYTHLLIEMKTNREYKVLKNDILTKLVDISRDI